MQITQIETIPVTIPINRRVGTVQNTKGFRFTSQILVVVIHTDRDLTGFGEVTGLPTGAAKPAWGENTDRHSSDPALARRRPAAHPGLHGSDREDLRESVRQGGN